MTDPYIPKKRVTCKRPNPNPLFQECLENIYQDAVKNNCEMSETYKEALDSLSKYPLPLKSGAECAILKGFDKNLCNLLDSRLKAMKQSEKRAKVGENEEEYCSEQPPSPAPDIIEIGAIESTSTGKTKKIKKKTKNLITNTEKCPSADYEMGRVVGADLVKESTGEVTINDIIFHGQPNDRVPSLEDMVITPPPAPVIDESPVYIEMPCSTFDVILLIDKNESGSLQKKDDPKTLLFNKYANFQFECRSLKVGDFTWVARCRKTGHELVLPYIIERKRMDDFGASIKDGRFHEQKFRLRKCGLQNIIYLIESYGSNKQVGLPMLTLNQAMANTSVQDGFVVLRTESLSHTVRFIVMLTQRLIQKLEYVFLRGCNRDTNGKELLTFDFFNKSSSKNKPLTVREMFIKMLLQLKGVSVEKALAITNKYSTPKLLMNAYSQCNEKEGELLLANLKVSTFSRNVGPSASKTIYMLFTKLEL